MDLNILYRIALSIIILQASVSLPVYAQKAYFVDGYHGGVYGHYPRWKTRYIVEELRKNPEWKINLEIEPETWDSVRSYDPGAYQQFKDALSDPSLSDRIEFVNPAYGQSYLFNISGESIIRQFALGIDKMRYHFPSVQFLTYSSEEPCFTSALPQILNSFGFKYAVLKNPNTCWGGYVRAYGGEKVNWIGPDGSVIPTVPRYDVEVLQKGSTWQTIAWANTQDYIKACLDQGIENPVGMCLQDAGWRGGPWLGSAWTKNVKDLYQPSIYTLWRDYFSDISVSAPEMSWRVSQEDIRVSLVWGAQVLQRLARQVRAAENKVVTAEKIAALHAVFNHSNYPESVFDRAWQTLLLGQHHDCWIVPYNGKPGHTWADKTKAWTDFTNHKSDSIIAAALPPPIKENEKISGKYIHIFNTIASARTEVVAIPLPVNSDDLSVEDDRGTQTPSQIMNRSGKKELVFLAEVPSLGYATYRVSEKKPASSRKKSTAAVLKDKTLRIETDLYQLIIDPSQGGVIKSLKAKTLKNKEFVDGKHERGFNELRGFFYEEDRFLSSKDHPATVTVLEDGPVRTKLSIEGFIGEHPFTQMITLCQNDPRIDFDLKIDWKGNPGIGKYAEGKSFKAENPGKAFYNDRYKLLALFPTNFSAPRIVKNAPFDVTDSGLENTFFNRWDSIKNNVMLNWVDLEERSGECGIALLADHTTSYAFGKDHPLGLTLQYSGTALWGRNYKITTPSQVHYALMPHAGKWDAAQVSNFSVQWNEPVVTVVSAQEPDRWSKSWINMEREWELSSLQMDGEHVLLRIYNAAGNEKSSELTIDDMISRVELVELDGKVKEVLPVKHQNGKSTVRLSMPRFGFRTLKMKLQ
jgi:alpha-mannosidase